MSSTRVRVRVGYGALVTIEFAAELAELATWFGDSSLRPVPSDKYRVLVGNFEPQDERDPGELEARGDGFCFRFDPREPRTSAAYVWGQIPVWQMACPIRQLLSWIAAHAGSVLLHASAVYFPKLERTVVFAGPSGCGKSTLACEIKEQIPEARVLGDDWILITEDECGVWHASQLYTSMKIAPPEGRAVEPRVAFMKSGDKVVLRGKLEPGFFRVGALVTPNIPRAESLLTITSTSAFETVERAAPSTLLQSSGVPPATLRTIRRFAESVPTYRMNVGKQWLPRMGDILPALLQKGA